MRPLAIAAALILPLATGASAAELAVGSGSTLDMGTGSLDLGCADLTVMGTLSAGTSGLTGARDVTIGSGGPSPATPASLRCPESVDSVPR